MIGILKLNIINVFLLCLNLAELNSTAIGDYTEDSSRSKQHDNDQPLNVVVNMDRTNKATNFNSQSSMEKQNPTSDNGWDTEEKLLENAWFRVEQESEEHNCLLDSLKVAIAWWCHTNGTLRRTNVHAFSHKQELDLSYHNIGHDKQASQLVAKQFAIEPNITVAALSLAHNNLTAVPFHTLQIMADSLKYLTLKGNPFIEANPHATDENASHCILNENDVKAFRLRNATKLVVASNRKQLAWATFPNMPALLELDLSHCDIKYIDKKAFQNLTNLKNLYMSHNKILNIPADTFRHTPHLQVLDLSFANVYGSLINRMIHDSASAESLLKLFYGVNIEQNFFNYLPNLIYLDLSHTKLRSGSAAAFSRICPSLKYLSLCYSSFPAFGKGIFANSSLIGLDLSGNANAVYSLDADVLASLSHSLKYLFFEKANLKDLAWLKPLKNLTFLALAGNSITSIAAHDFQPLTQLQILDLSSNHVSNWYSPVFQHNENLRILGLRDNNINFISSAMLGDLSTLIYLSLGGNNFICDCILHDMVDVSSLNNQLAQCEGSFAQTIKNHIHIDSVYLPDILKNSKLFFNTTLSMLDIPSLIVYQNLYKFKATFKKIQHSHRARRSPKMRFILKSLSLNNNSKACRHEHNSTTVTHFSRKFNNSMLKFQLLDYKEEHYWCYNQSRKENLRRLDCQRAYTIDNIEQELSTLATYISAVVGSFILIASAGIFVYVKRWHIYYYYSSVKSAALLSVFSKDKHDNFKNLCDQNSGVLYDVFISYCQNDRDWIVEELMPNIEETGDISVCLHERDFQVGITILDNIVSCMERSKAMLLVISANFLLSHWCQFEMQLAHHHILDLKKDNLILVFLEDIPRSKRPKNLQFLMKVKTYVKWPGGKDKDDVHPEERKLFWKRLKHSLRNIDFNTSESIA